MSDTPSSPHAPGASALPGAAPRAPEPPKKRKWGCLGSPWAIGCLGLLVMFLVAIVLVWIVNGRDIDPPDVSDLEVVLEPVPAGDNLLTYVMNGQGALTPPAGTQQIDDAQLGYWADIAQGRADVDGKWDDAAITALVAANGPALEELRAAVGAEHCQVPELDWTVAVPGLLDIRRLCSLAMIRAEQKRRAGDHAGALAEVWPAVRLGNRLQTGTGTLIISMIGVAVEGMALGTVRVIVADAACPAEVCADAANRLASLGDRGEGLARAFRAEFTMASKFLESSTQPGQVAGATGAGLPALLDRGPGFFLHLNRTKAMMAADFRIIVANANRLPSQVQAVPPPPTFDGFWGKAKLVGGGNAVGQLLHSMTMPGMARTVESRSNADAAARCTTAFAAVLAHQRRTGSRPATLAECMEAVPVDPFDGQPLRYDPAKGVIWTIGKNGTDEGGDCDDVAVTSPADRVWPNAAADPGLRLPPR